MSEEKIMLYKFSEFVNLPENAKAVMAILQNLLDDVPVEYIETVTFMFDDNYVRTSYHAIETDQEFEARLRRDQQYRTSCLERDRAEYERLKKKFGD